MPRYNEPPTASEMDRESEAEERAMIRMEECYNALKDVKVPSDVPEALNFIVRIASGFYKDREALLLADAQGWSVRLRRGNEYDGD